MPKGVKKVKPCVIRVFDAAFSECAYFMPPAVCVQAESKLFLGAAMPMGANVKPTEDGLFLDLSVPKSAKKSSHGHLCEQADGKEIH